MLRPPSVVLEHGRLEPLALALLARGRDRGHEPELRVDDARAVAGRAGALGVGAEQRGLHAVGLREGGADRVEQPGVRRRVAPSRAADRALVDRHDAVPARHGAVDQRALARPGHAGHDDEHAERDVDVDVLQVVVVGAAHLQRARPRPHRRASASPGRRGGDRSACRWRAAHRRVPSNTTSPPARAGARTQVDDVVGDRDRLRLVLDDEHRVALVAQPQQQRRSCAGCRGDAGRSSARRRRR